MPILEIEDTTLYYSVKGTGIPLVFIHPPLLTSANFMYQLEGLSQSFKVITFDIRGHGRSGYSKEEITYPLIVEDMLKILDHLDIEKAFICGYSTGGSIVLEYLLTKPNRALGGIIISGMSEVRDFYLKERITFAVKLAEKKRVPFLNLAITWGNADKRQAFFRLFKEASRGEVENIQQYYRYSLRYNCTRMLPKIDLPVLLVYGTKDKSFHRYARLLHKKIPHNQLVFLENEKHQLPTKAALKLNDVIHQFVSHQSNGSKLDKET
ncbi:alpha/beta fold hydrolase [Alkalihalobacillus sp. 1P02AB]|uniref:alpha/beta fold hydrolase n=1 Tax=Alkalihalobacillus sp. 1P02AB TaxID=3132260 RepID=UPI0039A64DAF